MQNISNIQRTVRYIQAKMLILGKKEANLDQKGPKMGNARFFRTVNISFPKEHHKISFYTKNQQNSMNLLEDMSQNVDFGQKRANLDQKGPKMGGTRFFPVLSLGYFIYTPIIQFKYAKLRRSYGSFPRNWPKCPFLG